MRQATKTREVKSEKLGFRDERISSWHRGIGYDFPATDLDFPLLEYDRGVPAAVIEYKHKNQKGIKRSHPTIRALSILCDRARLPFFIVRYADECDVFTVTPVNGRARQFVKETTLMCETVYIKLLGRLRKNAS